METPTSVFQLYFHSLKFFKALPHMLLLSLNFYVTKEKLFTFSTNQVAAWDVSAGTSGTESYD